jgi:hypothetical protein
VKAGDQTHKVCKNCKNVAASRLGA